VVGKDKGVNIVPLSAGITRSKFRFGPKLPFSASFNAENGVASP